MSMYAAGILGTRPRHVLGVKQELEKALAQDGKPTARDKFPVGADPSFSVIKSYDAAFNIPLVGAAFANRISYVISPDGEILYAYSDSHAEKHIENTLAAVKKWREEHKP